MLQIATLDIFREDNGIFLTQIGRDKPNNMLMANSLQKGNFIGDALNVGFLSRHRTTSSPRMAIFLAATTVRVVLWMAL